MAQDNFFSDVKFVFTQVKNTWHTQKLVHHLFTQYVDVVISKNEEQYKKNVIKLEKTKDSFIKLTQKSFSSEIEEDRFWHKLREAYLHEINNGYIVRGHLARVDKGNSKRVSQCIYLVLFEDIFGKVSFSGHKDYNFFIAPDNRHLLTAPLDDVKNIKTIVQKLGEKHQLKEIVDASVLSKRKILTL